MLNSIAPHFKVYTAQRGLEGIELAKKEQPDAILLDIIMPGMDGYEVCERLKNDILTKHIPVIMITAIRTDSQVHGKALEKGAEALFSKPIDLEQLATHLDFVLTSKEEEHQLRTDKEKLEELVQARTKEITRTNKKLRLEISERKLTDQKFRDLTKHIEEVREKERARIALDLHDDLGQRLTALNMDVAWIRKQLSENQSEIFDKTNAMTELLNETIRTVQKISSELRPSILDDLGLVAVIEWQLDEFTRNSSIDTIEKNLPEYLDVDEEVSITMFRIMQEALTNIIRHAHASVISVGLYSKNGMLKLVITDNGFGISDEALENQYSYGLMGMKERASSHGGEVSIIGNKEGGTKIIVTIPFVDPDRK